MTDTTPEAVERLTGPAAEAMPDGERLTALVQMCRALSAEVQRLKAPGEPMQALIYAANGLSFGDDWNGGTFAKLHGYREKLLVAIAKIKGNSASPQARAALRRASRPAVPREAWRPSAVSADVAALRENIAGLMHYSRHDGLCAMIGGYGYCTCGLEAKLDAARAALAKQGGEE